MKRCESTCHEEVSLPAPAICSVAVMAVGFSSKYNFLKANNVTFGADKIAQVGKKNLQPS